MGQSEPLTRWPVLVVEDEPILRMDAIGMVEKAGFEAVEAMSSADAIRLLEERLDIRLVYMDLDMQRLRKIKIQCLTRVDGKLLAGAHHP